MIKELKYNEVYFFWKNYLWPNREIITPMSTMRYMDKPYKEIEKKYEPTFYGYVIDDKIIGVNSGHASSKIHYRSRGLYVLPEYRGKNIGVELLKYSIQLAKKENKKYCWSLPKKTALKTYLTAGFEQTSNFFQTETSNLNCYVIKEL